MTTAISYARLWRFRMLVILIPLFLLLPVCFAQVNENAAAELAKASVRKALGRRDQSFVACQRDIDLETKFFTCSRTPAPFIFRLSLEGEEVIDERTVIVHSWVHGSPDFIVAVSDSGNLFRIHGFVDSKKEAEELALQYRINLEIAEDVRTFARFYITANPQNSIPPIVDSVQELSDRVRSQFKMHFGDDNSELRFSEWWQQHSNEIGKIDFSIAITRTGRQRFKVFFYSLRNLSDYRVWTAPGFLRVYLKLSSNGIITGQELKPLWKQWKQGGT